MVVEKGIVQCGWESLFLVWVILLLIVLILLLSVLILFWRWMWIFCFHSPVKSHSRASCRLSCFALSQLRCLRPALR
ncbi:hypothetical protein MKleb_5519 (plasmid) [Klebsiella sp. PL-2018]|nr:hypothetical protein MKleb_5519 [Klebsiella sp. PL-2018]